MGTCETESGSFPLFPEIFFQKKWSEMLFPDLITNNHGWYCLKINFNGNCQIWLLCISVNFILCFWDFIYVQTLFIRRYVKKEKCHKKDLALQVIKASGNHKCMWTSCSIFFYASIHCYSWYCMWYRIHVHLKKN